MAQPKTYRICLKILALLIALLLIAFGLYQFTYVSVKEPIDGILNVYYMYFPLSLFGLMMICAEIPLSFLITNCLFLNGYKGSGAFYMM